MNFYNEFDPKAATWLRELIKAGEIPDGIVDERSIEDVRPDELIGFTQCHFFAGIGGWPLALRLAGVPDTERLWTGSCPCQPFSTAGKGKGFADERHIWPAWQWLIEQSRPSEIWGEQVAAKAVEPWIDLVHADLEALGYAFGCVPFPSAGVGSPHIRDRAYWVGFSPLANAESTTGEIPVQPRKSFEAGSEFGRYRGLGRVEYSVGGGCGSSGEPRVGRSVGQRRQGSDLSTKAPDASLYGRLEYADGRPEHEGVPRTGLGELEGPSETIGMGDASSRGKSRGLRERGSAERASSTVGGRGSAGNGESTTGPTNGAWGSADWLLCRDGKWRPVEPGTFPLAYGVPARVGRLRGYGNAINPIQAAEFIKASRPYMKAVA